VFLTYRTTGRGTEPASGSFALLDMTPYGRGEAWQVSPQGWPKGGEPCWYWRADADGKSTWGPTSRPLPQWTRPGATPETTLAEPMHTTDPDRSTDEARTLNVPPERRASSLAPQRR